MKKQLKVGFFGASGSGKSTLAKWVSEEFKLPYIEGSSFSKILPKEDQDFLELMGYQGSGHAEVIRLSHQDPSFGWEFQHRVLKARINALKDQDTFVTDRTYVDNLAYYLIQSAATAPKGESKAFLDTALQSLSSHFTHLFFVLTRNPHKDIEVNYSRIHNYYYQRAMDGVFKESLALLREDQGDLPFPDVYTIDTWDLIGRKNRVKSLLNNTQYKLEL
jgi:GTPase SAR1 family protein